MIAGLIACWQVGVVDTWIEKYGASIAGYFVM